MENIIILKKRYIYILSAIIVFLLFNLQASNASKKSILKTKLGKVEGQINTVKKQIRIKTAQKRTVIGQLTATQQDLEKTQSKLSSNKLLLMDSQSDLNATIKRLDRTKKQLKRRQGLLERRVIDIYEGEDLNYINVVLGSADMWTFLTRAYYMKKILDTDTDLINQIQHDKKSIESDKLRQTRRVAQIDTLQVDLLEQRNEVSSLAEDQRSQLTEIENSKDLYEKALDELLATSRQIEDQIKRMQSTPKGRARYARAFRGGLSLPCQGSFSSRFGYRVHPITHVYKLHTGVDIRAPYGTSIHAAANGTVIIANWMGAYGNAVVIDHGGGVSTLYGHCSRLNVHVGQDVKRGQLIAKVGSTGYSTGNHCHFEKRVNGTPVNPL